MYFTINAQRQIVRHSRRQGQDYETILPTARLRCGRCKWVALAVADNPFIRLDLPVLLCICGGQLRAVKKKPRRKGRAA
jgi:hypothetical protein